VLVGATVPSFAGPPVRPRPGIENLGVNVFDPAVNGRSVALPVREVDEDLNGDGDTGDVVMHVQAQAHAPLRNLRLTSHSVTAAHRGFLFWSGHYLRNAGAPLLDMGFLTWLPRSGPGVVVFEHHETDVDLNGDGDYNDAVATDLSRQGSVTNLGVAIALPFGHLYTHLAGDELVAFVGAEADSGSDFNEDGDQLDHVIFVWDARQDSLDPVAVEAKFDQLAVGGRLVAWSGGPGGYTGVTRVWNADSREIVLSFPHKAYRVDVEGGQVAFSVSEGRLGGDHNGDGDLSDYIAFVADGSTGVPNDTGIGVHQYDVSAHRAGKHQLLLHASENFSTDLNGDGDFYDRSVPHVWDTTSGSSVNLGVAGTVLASREEGAIIGVWELGQGITDLNGDGDITDMVLFFYDAPTGELTNLALATADWAPFVNLRSGVVFGVPEAGWRDANGDGDLDDVVLHALRIEDLRLVNLGLAVKYGTHWGADGDTLVIQALGPATGDRASKATNDTVRHTAFRIDLDRVLRHVPTLDAQRSAVIFE
jgi:hypothetical protein